MLINHCKYKKDFNVCKYKHKCPLAPKPKPDYKGLANFTCYNCKKFMGIMSNCCYECKFCGCVNLKHESYKGSKKK